MTRLQDRYNEVAVPALNDKFKYGNVMLVPKLEKVIVNMRLGDCKDNTKAMESAVKELEQNYRPEGNHNQGKKIRIKLQSAQRYGYRRKGYASQG
jgi:ribosomal protein L5